MLEANIESGSLLAREEGARSSDFAIVASTLSGSKREESDTFKYYGGEETGRKAPFRKDTFNKMKCTERLGHSEEERVLRPRRSLQRAFIIYYEPERVPQWIL